MMCSARRSWLPGLRSAAVILLLSSPVTGGAQVRLTGGDLAGTIADQSGGAVPGATITVINVDTGVVRVVTSDGEGRYQVAALPPGRFDISVALAGFITERRNAITLLLGQLATVDVVLKIATVSDEVQVTGDAPLVHVAHTEVSSVIERRTIESLPINGRNFISFSVITPGVTTDRTPQQGASFTSGLSFSGQGARFNNIMVDGVDNNDQLVGAVRATFSQEAIREFQVLTDCYSAEFGKASGGVVNIVTKSGTNEIRGTAFAYFRDNRLNARSAFERADANLPKAPYRQAQTGGTAGGPLQRGKTFLFASFERNDVRDSRLVTIDPVAAVALAEAGFPVGVGHVPLDVTNTEVLGKIDHHWNSNHFVAVRASYAAIDREGLDDYGGVVARSRGSVQKRTDWSIAGAQTNVIGGRWVHELRGQFARDDQNILGLDPTCGGPCERQDQGGPTLEITGVASVGRHRFTPAPRVSDRVQVTDTIGLLAGRHHIKAGIDFSRIASGVNTVPVHLGGRYIFSAMPGLGVVSALDGLRKGLPAAYVQSFGDPNDPYNTSDISLFAQDEWTYKRLVLKPGVRYQHQFWPEFPYDVSDVGGARLRYPFPRDKHHVAPRLAAGYDLRGDRRTALHASYGVFHDIAPAVIASVSRVVTGTSEGLRTVVLGGPLAAVAWSSPSHRLTEAQANALVGGTFASSVVSADPAFSTPYTRQAAGGIEQALGTDFAFRADAVYVRGFDQPGTIDYNPLLPARLGAGRRPNDRPCTAGAAGCVNGGLPGTSASVLQFTSFGGSWYKGLTLSLNKRWSHRYQLLAAYTLSKAEDTSTDFQTNFIVENSGFGRNPDDPFGLPLGFDPTSEKGRATHDQRHRVVISGVYQLPRGFAIAGILTAASGRPYTPLAGADLNGDGNGGSFPPDRARTNPLDPSTSVRRNSATTEAQYNVDLRVSRRFRIGRRGSFEALVEAFNLFNTINFVEDTNQSSFVIFGSGAFPDAPLPMYGKYTLSLPPRQVQLAGRISF